TDSTHHDAYGYFDPTARARYFMTGNPTLIQTTGLTENGANVPLSATSKKASKSAKSAKSEKRKGRFLKPKSSKSAKSDTKGAAEPPFGFAYVASPDAEPVLLADLDKGTWRTFRRCYDDDKPSTEECVPVSEEDDSSDVDPVELSDELINSWVESPDYQIVPIEDLRNVNVNTNIKVDNAFLEQQFTLRISPNGDNKLSNANDNFPWESKLKLSELSHDISSNAVSVTVTNKGPDVVATGQVKFYVVNLDGSIGWRKTVPIFGPLDKGESIVITEATKSGESIMDEETSLKLVVTAEAFAATGKKPTLNKKREEIVRYLRGPANAAAAAE
ncbi:MAG: hypothetical protein SGILL_004639, partial [Bacillariaceae sp.]